LRNLTVLFAHFARTPRRLARQQLPLTKVAAMLYGAGMTSFWPSLSHLPFLFGAGVLAGVALWSYLRSAELGALLIAIGGGLRVVHQLCSIWWMFGLANGASSHTASLGLFSAALWLGALCAEVLVVLGVVLLLVRVAQKDVSLASADQR
jgi:hypothetical protein